MLLQFKNAEDEEECPLPEELRQDLLEFHQDLLAHCGKKGIKDLSSSLCLETSSEVSLSFPDFKYLQY